MNAKIESILRKRTINMFNSKWYEDTVNEIISKGQDFKGYVYFVSNGISDNVKIGKSSSLNNRLNSFRTSFGEGVFLWGFIYVENYTITEKELHEFFKENHIRNEWFEIDMSHFKKLQIDFDFIPVNGFWKKETEIIDGLIFKIDKVEDPVNEDGASFYALVNSLNKNNMYYNSEFRNILFDYSEIYKDWSPKKIHLQLKEWSLYYNRSIKFKKDVNGRGFIIK